MNTSAGPVKGDVINAIPPQRAGGIIATAGLNNVGGRWAGVDVLSYESTAARAIHVIGDAAATTQAKAGHIANQEAKVCVDAILRGFKGLPPDAAPVTNSVCFDPVTSGYPSLIVEGAITLSLSGSDLSESSEGTNFNRTGSPYAGATDSSKTGNYPSEFGGLIYVSGALTVNGTLATYAPEPLFYCVNDIKNHTWNLDDIRVKSIYADKDKRLNPLGKSPDDVWCIHQSCR